MERMGLLAGKEAVRSVMSASGKLLARLTKIDNASFVYDFDEEDWESWRRYRDVLNDCCETLQLIADNEMREGPLVCGQSAGIGVCVLEPAHEGDCYTRVEVLEIIAKGHEAYKQARAAKKGPYTDPSDVLICYSTEGCQRRADHEGPCSTGSETARS